LKLLIDSDGKADLNEMVPWYKGFKGTIALDSENKYITTGCVKRSTLTSLDITELPIGRWTQTYKEFLETLVEANEIIDYKNNCDDTSISFKIIMQKSVLDQMSPEDIIKKLKLTSSISTSNMHVFDSECKIRKMSCPQEIIYHFYRVRRDHYISRKKYLVDKMNSDFELMDSKIKFIKLVVESKIIIFNKKKDFIIKQITEHSLLKVNGSYDYLLDMKIHSLTLEKIKDLESKMETITNELTNLKKTSIEKMWVSELLTLEF